MQRISEKKRKDFVLTKNILKKYKKNQRKFLKSTCNFFANVLIYKCPKGTTVFLGVSFIA